MAVGFPTKANWAAGDVLTAAQMDDLAGTVNYLSPVGQTNGSTLVVNSANASGLGWSPTFFAGKNKIINGDFGIWQRGTTFNACATGTYTADRWSGIFMNGTVNVTRQAFTAGTAPVAGYESSYYLQLARTATAGTNDYFGNKMEDVRTFAGQTVTYSFWAKATSGTPTVLFYLSQNFGSGGSASVDIAATTQATLSTSWARYSATFTVPSIAGKTIGTNSYLAALFALQIADGNNTWQIWGVQVESGSNATQFQTATGTLQGELAACQRYYWRSTSAALYSHYGLGACFSTTNASVDIKLPVTMRVAPSSVDYGTLANYRLWNSSTAVVVTSMSIDTSTTTQDILDVNVGVASGLTTGTTVYLTANNSAATFIGASAEL